MATKKVKQKKETGFFTVEKKHLNYAVIVLVLVFILYWALKVGARNYSSPEPRVEYDTTSEVVTQEDLNKAVKDLDSKDLDLIDKELNSLDTETSDL